MSERGIALYVQDILDSIRNIDEYMKGFEFDDFLEDRKARDAVARNIEIIGEAARNMPKEIHKRHPEIPWEDIIGMRNKMIHEYSGIDHQILWKTIRDDLPDLKKKIAKLH